MLVVGVEGFSFIVKDWFFVVVFSPMNAILDGGVTRVSLQQVVVVFLIRLRVRVQSKLKYNLLRIILK